MTAYAIDIGPHSLLIETAATPDEMKGAFVATCLETGDTFGIRGWLIESIEELTQ